MGHSIARSGGTPDRLRRMALCAAALFAAACTYTPAAAPKVEYGEYLIGPPDRLVVTVLPEPPLVESVLVRPDGMITVQLVGDVAAGGKTTTEVANEIQNRIGRFKRGALVTVALGGAESAMVTVLGEVRGPTTFALTRQMRVSEALGTVGGPTLFANDDEVRVVRPGSPPRVIDVDMDAIRGGDLRTNVQVYGGDIVYVPPTVLATIGYAFQQLLFPFTPFFGAAGIAAGVATN